jgi:hypothetical protein
VDKPQRPTENAALSRGIRKLLDLRRCLRDGSLSLDTSAELTPGDCMTLIRFACAGDERIPLNTLSVMAFAESLFDPEAARRWSMAVHLVRLTGSITPDQAEQFTKLIDRGGADDEEVQGAGGGLEVGRLTRPGASE